MSKNIYNFFVDFGRMGEIEGVFLAESKQVAEMLIEAPELYFGEVLGKHSDISVDIKAEHINLLSDDQTAVEVLEKIFGDTISGFNPMDQWEEQRDE